MFDVTNGSKASESLLTRKSFALSLAAPRVPPHGTAHRALLVGGDPTVLPWARHHHNDEISKSTERKVDQRSQQETTNKSTAEAEVSYHKNSSLHRRLVTFLQRSAIAMKNRPRLPHPHLPVGPVLAEHVTRSLGVWFPLSWQNWLRDSGYLRAFVDNLLMACSKPTYALVYPEAYHEFQCLSQQRQRIRYGNHPSQIIDMFFPENRDVAEPRGLLFFVHGGAWGSGTPFLYRLVASPFLKELNIAVAIVGYRTYPCGNVLAQVQDLELASEELAHRYPELCGQNAKTELGVCVMGHSSGAHISFLMMTEWTRRRMEKLEATLNTEGETPTQQQQQQQQQPANNDRGIHIDSFVGISGPYNISHHFDYEASRGLEEISPLKPACGYSRQEFRKHSPALRIVDCMSKWSAECENRALDNIIPRVLLMHGIEDDVVPFTSSAEAASLLRSCGVTKLEETYIARTGHNECCVQLMLGGKVQDILIDWLRHLPEKHQRKQAQQQMVINSRL